MQKLFKRSLLITLLSPLNVGLLIYALPAQAVGLQGAQLISSIEANRIIAQARTTASSGALTEGATGAKVKELQQRLKEKGFNPGGFDGTFGPGTKAALVAFQKSKGLQADGVAGAKTLAALGIKLTTTNQSAKTIVPASETKASQTPKSSSSTPTETAASPTDANQAAVAVADRFFWSGAKGNLGLSLVGKFNSPEKMMETFYLSKPVAVFNGKLWKLNDILVSADFNANGNVANWKVSGPRPVLERYLDSLKAGYQSKSLLYDFAFSEVNFKPTAAFEAGG